LPSWWAGKRTNLRLGLKARAKGATKKAFATEGSETLVDFDCKLAVGKEEISYEELMALARLKTPLVKFRGKWMELRPEQIEPARQFWKSRSFQQGTLMD